MEGEPSLAATAEKPSSTRNAIKSFICLFSLVLGLGLILFGDSAKEEVKEPGKELARICQGSSVVSSAQSLIARWHELASSRRKCRVGE